MRRSVYCKSCSREYIRGHYDNNKRYYLDKARRRNKKIKKDNRVYIANYLKSHPCVDCGEKDILVLEFDHKNRTEKRYNISKMLMWKLPLEKLVEEIDKCEVRCANCHRRKTEKEQDSWKLEYAPVAQLDRAFVFETKG